MPKIIAKKEDWVRLGYRLFSEKGIVGIVIEKMSKKLGVNKSSFYWHFSTRKAFIEQIIDFWEKESTSKIIMEVNKESSPKDKFDRLIELSFLKDNNIDFFFHVKKYAKSNKELNLLIEKADRERMNFTKDVLRSLGFSEREALVKSSIFYKYLIGYHEMIRYKEQSPSYTAEVKDELRHFINF